MNQVNWGKLSKTFGSENTLPLTNVRNSALVGLDDSLNRKPLAVCFHLWCMV